MDNTFVILVFSLIAKENSLCLLLKNIMNTLMFEGNCRCEMYKPVIRRKSIMLGEKTPIF